MRNINLLTIFIVPFFIFGCASKILEVENADKQLKIDDYDKSLKIREIPDAQKEPVQKVTLQIEKKVSPPSSKKKVEEKVQKIQKPKKHLPELEGQEGFDGRRPVVDPFIPGEKVTLKLSYFNVTAGTMEIEVLPFVQVNGRKSYHFQISGKTSDFFSNIYSVDDKGETYVDFENMTPYSHSISVKETKQLREIRSYFDWKKNTASYWEKRITKKKGLEEFKYEWDILPYSQNIFSAIFYMRVFKLEPGKKIQFRVADNRKNIVVTGHILDREVLKTPMGDLKTIKLKPEIEIDGTFKPMGDVFFWLTDDDRKFIVRLESKIKIGTIIGSLVDIKRE